MSPYEIDTESFSPSMTRRRFLRLAGCACLAGVGAQYAAVVAPSRIVVNSTVVPVAGLPHSLEGLRVGVMSDFHVGDYVSADFVSTAVEIMNSLHPDMVVLPGDFFQDRPEQAEACADALSDLIANLGVFACPGNHDHHLDLRKTSVPLARAGVDLLVNESRSIAYGAATLRLVGLDSATEGLADHSRALRSVPEDEMAFVLVHEPDYADFLAQTSGHTLPLQISGHSHGGQVRLPLLGAPILPSLAHHNPRGLRRVEGTERQVFTSTGVGVSVPVRLNCPPEVAVQTLHRTPAA
jgi:predicted MPP superfamily phosphohydrolase